MIAADPRSLLGHWCQIIADMKPGECLTADVRDLMDIPSYHYNDAESTPADRIMGNIVGSGYTHSYSIGPDGRTITFMRHEDTGEVRYRDPDRR